MPGLHQKYFVCYWRAINLFGQKLKRSVVTTQTHTVGGVFDEIHWNCSTWKCAQPNVVDDDEEEEEKEERNR